MTAIRYVPQKPPVMAIALANRANTDLLQRMLGDDFHIQETFAEESAEPHVTVDLIVVDTASLKHYWERILDLRRRAAPLILPVLLVVDSRSRIPPRITDELGYSVNDILRIPATQLELKARIDNLLRLCASSTAAGLSPRRY
ncbi:hypothetical protein L0636_10960 [Halomonas janggokensis]|uniref:Response regulatory domain-containing protein n=1 Tax=Vreelandella janggokensis TaxID=370767 RepID=A0ABT4IQC5_9GAMM|nr:hypothetical protein [Halomonas janggokensis]MCZ0925872.1 hypothetical protein [Halomonas janggokensis]MCZ0930939.1 hypothetical protein [Halomonas janggokensis]